MAGVVGMLLVGVGSVCSCAAATGDDELTVASPNGRLRIVVELDGEGRPAWTTTYRGTPIATGTCGLAFAESGRLEKGLSITGVRRVERDETYAIAVGKASSARDRHRELTVSLAERQAPKRTLELVFRALDDGIAFRYVVPRQIGLEEFVLTDELTRIGVSGEPTARYLPLDGYTTSYENYYETKRASAIAPETLIGLPMLLTLSGQDLPTVWLGITEAGLENYAGMYLSRSQAAATTFDGKLSPLPGRSDGAKVRGSTPLVSPWRVLMIADEPGRLLESNLVFHLNPPTRIQDTSWIRPGKTTFPWWNGYVLEGVDFQPGMNTQTHKHYIDFCASHGIPYHSLDGDDEAWYGGPIIPDGPTDVTRAAPGLDLPELLRYAQAKGIRLRLWLHWRALAPQIDEALALYEKWGIEGVMVDFMDRDDQEMVNFYHEVAEKAARHRLTVTWHGAFKPTGMERTWPNVLTSEAVLGQEYNKWSEVGTPPEHNVNVALVRSLAGPLDYHQGGMRNVRPEDYQPRYDAPSVQGTRGHQLAMYVVYLDPCPMTADYPEAYHGQPGWEFIRQVPTTWDETRALCVEAEKCVVMARRKGRAWYLGGLTAAEAREIELPLDFLGAGPFRAELLVDDATDGPTALVRREQAVLPRERLRIAMPRGGGFVARVTPIEP